MLLPCSRTNRIKVAAITIPRQLWHMLPIHLAAATYLLLEAPPPPPPPPVISPSLNKWIGACVRHFVFITKFLGIKLQEI